MGLLTGWLAISGIPIFAGFFSKDEILWKTWSAPAFSLPSTSFSKLLWVIGAITAFLTAIYMTRMMVMTFWGTERFRDSHVVTEHHEVDEHEHHGVHEPHESPWVMTVPLIVLAVLSTFGGLIGVPYALGSLFSDHPTNYIEQTLEPAISHVPTTAAHTSETNQADPIEWLSAKPQPHDGAPPVHSLEGTETGSGQQAGAAATAAHVIAQRGGRVVKIFGIVDDEWLT